MSANLEAIAYFNRGIETLEQLPDNDERARQELALQLSLGHANIVAKGHGSVGAEKAYTRAQILTEKVGDAADLVPALFGLWRSYIVGRTLDEPDNVARQLRRIAEQKPETELQVVADYTSGFTALCMGNPGHARPDTDREGG